MISEESLRDMREMYRAYRVWDQPTDQFGDNKAPYMVLDGRLGNFAKFYGPYRKVMTDIFCESLAKFLADQHEQEQP